MPRRKLIRSEDDALLVEARVRPSNRIVCPKCGHENTITLAEIKATARPSEPAFLHKICGNRGCKRRLRYFIDRTTDGGEEKIIVELQDI